MGACWRGVKRGSCAQPRAGLFLQPPAATRRDQFPSKGLALIQNCPAHGDSGCRCQQLAEVLLGSTGAMASPSTILDATMLCRQIFKSATQYPRLMDQEWAENRLADFKLWAKGAGALAPGKASLDHRLASSAETHSIILNLLVMLSMLMEDCIAAATNTHHTRLEGGLGLSNEELQSMKEVDDNLSQLTRVMIAVRKAGTRSRLEKADASFDAASPPLRAFRRHLELLLLVRAGEEQTSDSVFQLFDQERLTAIQLRLIDANIRRRNRFLYAQRHALKLGLRSRARNDVLFKMKGSITLPLDLHRPSTASGGTTWMTENIPGDPPDQETTTATIPENPVILPPKEVVTPAATTVLSVTTSRISYPAPPPIRNNQGIFRCPCCCQSLPAATGQGRQWK